MSAIPQFNLVLAWLWILLGFISGLALGLFFHGEHWLGGYASFKRRLYRLAHISFFGLGAVNLLFYLSAQTFPTDPVLSIASSAFIVGAITMPACCIIMAHFPKTRMFFAVPVLSLVAGAVLTLAFIIQSPAFNHQLFRLDDASARQASGTVLQRSGYKPPIN